MMAETIIEMEDKSIAFLIPCFNEELSVGKVVKDCRDRFPSAAICVCDNNSSDKTAEIAEAAGARVVRELRKGKGFAVRRLLEEVEADIYVLIDGDDTYPVEFVESLIQSLEEHNADMVVGSRLGEREKNDFRPMHRSGNRLITGAINLIFESSLTDVMSGLRVFSRRFAEQVPLVSRGFEIETQMTIQALYYQFRMAEVEIPCRSRPVDSFSKLSTFRDGAKIVLALANAFKAYRPLLFFSCLALPALLVGLLLLLYVALVDARAEFLQALGFAGLGAGILSVFCGLILDAVNHRLRELGQLVLIRTGKRL